RKLARALRIAGLPTVIFINKIDRIGARFDPLLGEIHSILGFNPLPLVRVEEIGFGNPVLTTLDWECLADQENLVEAMANGDASVLDQWSAAEGAIDGPWLTAQARSLTGRQAVVPVVAGSATKGIGVDLLLHTLRTLVPSVANDATADLQATVFKIDRTATGEKLAIVRIDQGTLLNRARVPIWRAASGDGEPVTSERIKGIDCYHHGTCLPVQQAEAGDIVCLKGLAEVRIGDRLGTSASRSRELVIARPRLESLIAPLVPAQANALHLALAQLAESDPLIDVHANELTGALTVRLFGVVQQEVLMETLRGDYGIETRVGEPQPICIERPHGTGEALEVIGTPENPFFGTVGFRISPAQVGSGLSYQAEPGALPPAYYRVIEETTYETLQEGLRGWGVTDIAITLTQVGYWSPVTTGADFRRLTPLVLMTALDRAGTTVCEPIEAFEVVCPAESLADVVHTLITGSGTPEESGVVGDVATVRGTIPTGAIQALERRIYGFGRGTTSLTTKFLRYDPVHGTPPERTRRSINPFHRAQYLAAVAQGKVLG
ncbi:MAG TPA: GTP-binding protein, partial [Thermomicrobiales bacterium]|nr:GTP-binding protein [Thermomicrobiales bacterium]